MLSICARFESLWLVTDSAPHGFLEILQFLYALRSTWLPSASTIPIRGFPGAQNSLACFPLEMAGVAVRPRYRRTVAVTDRGVIPPGPSLVVVHGKAVRGHRAFVDVNHSQGRGRTGNISPSLDPNHRSAYSITRGVYMAVA